jgi:hypothetical protein
MVGNSIQRPSRRNGQTQLWAPLLFAGYGLANSDALQNEVKIAELVPEIFSGDRFLVGSANLFRWEKCTE